ncbi:MAG: DUF3821 domain-containing protein [Methanoregulaceae archaeon]|nr:DUF3821 domain-containing protein [Methanoregulaceae archaeon]
MTVIWKWVAIVVIAGALLVFPASAGIATITRAGTTFLGEQGLDLTGTGVVTGGQIAWWGTGVSLSLPPSDIQSVADATNFYIDPALFATETGPWYTYPDKQLAFYVQSPDLSLRIIDETAGFTVSPQTMWVPRGDFIAFRIDTNLYVMASRPDSSGAPVTIRIRDQNGVEYSGVVDAAGNFQSLSEIPVAHSPFETGGIWYTGNSMYTNGFYSVWAECNANGMFDNYDVLARTTTGQAGINNVLIQPTNPLITSSVTPSPTPTTVPATQTSVATTPPTTAPITTPPTSPPSTVTTAPPTTPPTRVPTTTTPGFGSIASIGAGIAAIAVLVRFRH